MGRGVVRLASRTHTSLTNHSYCHSFVKDKLTSKCKGALGRQPVALSTTALLAYLSNLSLQGASTVSPKGCCLGGTVEQICDDHIFNMRTQPAKGQHCRPQLSLPTCPTFLSRELQQCYPKGVVWVILLNRSATFTFSMLDASAENANHTWH